MSTESAHIGPLRLFQILKQGTAFQPHEMMHFQRCIECRHFARGFLELASAAGHGTSSLLDIPKETPAELDALAS